MDHRILPLPWDSEFMGFPVGRFQGREVTAEGLAQALAEARRLGFRLLYWSVPPDDHASAASARGAGLSLLDRKVRYEQLLSAAEAEGARLPANIETATAIGPDIVALALLSGVFSRFRRDPGFAPGIYERLYTSWIENSIASDWAREVLVYRASPGQPATGLVTLALRPGVGQAARVDIGLLAVAQAHRGQGIGAQLMIAARQRARTWGYDTLQVVTQLDNEAGCRFYEHEGFRLEYVEHVYHIWI